MFVGLIGAKNTLENAKVIDHVVLMYQIWCLLQVAGVMTEPEAVYAVE
jgi:hypothetical protein